MGMGFNLPNKENNQGIEGRVKKWVRIFSRINNEPIIGYLEKTDHYHAVLRPYAKLDYDNSGQPFYRIEKKQPHEFPKNLIGNHESFSKKSTENYCKFMNKRFDLDSIKNEREKLHSILEINQMRYEMSKGQIITVPRNFNIENLK